MDLSIGWNGMHHVWMTDSSLCMNVNLEMWWNGLKWIVFEPDTLFKKNKAWLHELWIRSERGELPKNPKKLRGHTNCLQMCAALRPSSALQPAHEVVVLFGHLNLSIKLVFFCCQLLKLRFIPLLDLLFCWALGTRCICWSSRRTKRGPEFESCDLEIHWRCKYFEYSKHHDFHLQ